MQSRTVLSACVVAAALAGCRSTRPAPAVASTPAPAPLAAREISEPGPAEVAAVETRPVRWLPGLQAVAFSDHPSGRGEERLGPPTRDCQTSDTAVQSITADVAAESGAETIIASIAHGVVVFAAEGQELARAAVGCGGAGDELEAIAFGTAEDIGRVIAVLVRTGGLAETTTRVDLFRIDGEDTTELERLFSGPVEVRDGDRFATGRLELVPGGVLFRKPGGRSTTWTFDVATRTLIRTQRPAFGSR
jgi:hypothetical protein